MIPVLHLRTGEALYGAERMLLALASATPAPYSPIIGAISRTGSASPLMLEASRRGLPAIQFPSASRFDLACARRVAEAARSHQAGLLHAHDPKSLGVAACASALARVPLVATFHGETRASLKLRAYEGVARILGNFTRGIVAVSSPLQRRLRRWVYAAPVYLIPNALPEARPLTCDERRAAREMLGLDQEQTVICVIGRLSLEKGHRVLLKALARLRRPPQTLFVGDGPLRESLQKAAARLPVKFIGYLPDARAIYAASDLVIIPSLTEGLPIVALEAQALGVCVLSSRVGGLPELLSDGAGYTVPSGDPAALAQALAGLCENEAARRLAAERGVKRARELHSVRAVADLYAGMVYARALSSASSSADHKPLA